MLLLRNPTTMRALFSSSMRMTTALSALASPAFSTAATPIRNVVVVGGTHGNEYTGVWCIRELDAKPPTCYPSLQISTLLGNPQAFAQNRRFVDIDLNRQFTTDKLAALTNTIEGKRALELNALLGPKEAKDKKTDVIIDLHTTTTNMGTTIIIPQNDAIMAQAAAYILHKVPCCKILMHTIPDAAQRPNLASVGHCGGLTIEVGPVPQGVLRHDAVDATNDALHACLEFLERRNRNADKVQTELKQAFSSGKIPCFRSAPLQRPGQELSGKISWPSAEDNENFPLYLVHKSVQDRDFCLVKKGDPLFQTLDGTVIPYNGSHGDEVHLIFVNEGGYYYKSSGTGIGVAIATEYELETGTLMDKNKVAEEAKQ